MTLVSYILSSILLSWIGLVVYLLFRWLHPALQGQRIMIWLVILTSLGIPLTAPFFNSFGPDTVDTRIFKGSEPNILDFCHCEVPNTGHVILYQASRIYDFLLANTPTLFVTLLVCTLFFLIRYSLQIMKLVRLVRKYPNEEISISGKKVFLVKGIDHLAAGSLRLWRRYIFWNQKLDELPEEARQSIIWHEFSHIQQCNTYEKLILNALQGIWFLNPVLYFFRRELNILSEYQADEYATVRGPSRKAYAHLLLSVKSQAKFSLVHFFKSNLLRNRIERILGQKPRFRLSLVPTVAIGLLCLFSSEIYTQSYIQNSLHEIKVYEFMSKAHGETGQEEFCVKCTNEAVECQ